MGWNIAVESLKISANQKAQQDINCYIYSTAKWVSRENEQNLNREGYMYAAECKFI